MKFALTIDVEDWYHTKEYDLKDWSGFEDRIEKSLMRILELLFHNNTSATFFILGCVAKKHPNLIREIVKCGHEIGSHGMNHTLIACQNRDEFKEDIMSSKALIEDAAGREVSMYRASSWSVGKDTLWALEVLEECNFRCDSSIQPFKTPLSGMNNAPDRPFYPIVNGRQLKILEFPSTVLKTMGMSIPFSGGFYLRFWPYFMIKKWFQIAGRDKDAMVYCHPWEIDTEQPKLKGLIHLRMVHYYNLKTTYEKLDKLTQDFKFCSLGEVIGDKQYPAIEISN